MNEWKNKSSVSRTAQPPLKTEDLHQILIKGLNQGEEQSFLEYFVTEKFTENYACFNCVSSTLGLDWVSSSPPWTKKLHNDL